MINANNVFSLFSSSSKDKDSEAFSDLGSHPHILLGFFTRMILRGDSFNKELSKMISESSQVAIDEMYKANKFVIYNRAYEYLQKINPDNIQHQNYLLEKNNSDFLVASNRALEYFISLEHYEKCNHIKKIQDIVNFS